MLFYVSIYFFGVEEVTFKEFLVIEASDRIFVLVFSIGTSKMSFFDFLNGFLKLKRTLSKITENVYISEYNNTSTLSFTQIYFYRKK